MRGNVRVMKTITEIFFGESEIVSQRSMRNYYEYWQCSPFPKREICIYYYVQSYMKGSVV